MSRSISGNSILFHWSVYLSLCQYHNFNYCSFILSYYVLWLYNTFKTVLTIFSCFSIYCSNQPVNIFKKPNKNSYWVFAKSRIKLVSLQYCLSTHHHGMSFYLSSLTCECLIFYSSQCKDLALPPLDLFLGTL